jgi:hypothetical protein
VARYRVLERSYISDRLVDAGEEVEYEGVPAHNLEPLDKAAKAAAARAPRILQPDADRLPGNWAVITWSGLLNSDDGAPVDMVAYADRSVQVEGTFGTGGNCRIEGSLDGVNYRTLTDPQGNALDFGTAKIEALTELVRFIRPRITAGDGATNLDCTLLVRGTLR